VKGFGGEGDGGRREVDSRREEDVFSWEERKGSGVD